MARVESLGLHSPAALPYLIREGVLPPNPSPETYQWETYVFDHGHGDVEEEILATKTCVVWSQDQSVRNVYRFDLEGEEVIQAVFTAFPSERSPPAHKQSPANATSNGHDKAQATARMALHSTTIMGTKKVTSRPDGNGNTQPDRALVVLLKTKAHIYYLQGSSHIVDLPFEIKRLFPAPCGLLLQRKLAPAPRAPPTPQVPPAPYNSFFSSQIQSSASFLQSPVLARSFGGVQSARPIPSNGKGGLDSLFQDLVTSPNRDSVEEAASLYTLTSPLSQLGVVTYSIQHQKPRVSGKTAPGLSVEFESLDPAEEVVYVSAQDEVGGSYRHGQPALLLLVTSNPELQSLTLWHAWYIEEQSLRSLLQQRVAHKEANARRRTSFLSASMGTGATTPAVRQRDTARESFAAPVRLPGEPASFPQAATFSRKPTRQEEEDVMASQMDPDFQLAASQQPVRDNRRISSLNADVRAPQGATNASFATIAKRNPSFGGPSERRSFNRRKSRGSTPGSVFSKSLGPEDDLLSFGSEVDLDEHETTERVLRHIRATFEAASTGSLFGGLTEDFKPEMIVRKLHSFSGLSQASHPGPRLRYRVAVLRDSPESRSDANEQMGIYIHDRASKEVQCFKLAVKRSLLWPESDSSYCVAVPSVIAQANLGKCDGLVKLRDVSINAILLSDRGLLFSPQDYVLCPLPSSAGYRVYHPLEAYSPVSIGHNEAGRNRRLSMPQSPLLLEHYGAHGTFDEIDLSSARHRRCIQLRPRNAYIEDTLKACEIVLPSSYSTAVRRIWCTAHAWLSQHPDDLSSTASDLEWIAVATTVFTFAIPLVDEKARAALTLSRLATGKRKESERTSSQLHRQRQEAVLLARPAWASMGAQHSQSGNAFEDSVITDKQLQGKDHLLFVAAALALELYPSLELSGGMDQEPDFTVQSAVKLLLGLHILSEERKLCALYSHAARKYDVAPLIAQLGAWLHLDAWSSDLGSYYNVQDGNRIQWAYIKAAAASARVLSLMNEPVGVFEWFEHVLKTRASERYPSLDIIAGLDMDSPLSPHFMDMAKRLTPRIVALSNMIVDTAGLSCPSATMVSLMVKHNLVGPMLETLPEAMAASFKESIAECERQPPTTSSRDLLHLVGREDLAFDIAEPPHAAVRVQGSVGPPLMRDVQTICHALDHHSHHSAKTREAGRHAISQLIFAEDRRLIDAISLMHYNSMQVAECPKQPDWSDAHHFEQCRRVMQYVVTRMIALPAGDAMIHFDSQTPLPTEKYHLTGFSSACLMQPMNHGLQVDRSGLTEEKVNWAFFHAGASAGLRISRSVKGIDTSWIAFNKPNELTNRHAGLLLALGLNGHLRSLAKWLSFKYLTPKHTMTSVGLLLGLSASYIGTTDSLITRMLSVHITRMLPPGAAELNVSSTTQTAGLMGIGLLYHNTQHRRMSEVMLSEVEIMELEDPDNGPDTLRDESYRLAAGFALGLINLAKGNNLQGLHGMQMPERLLGIAVGPRPVGAVHVFDRATAGAIIAVALVYMKSGDEAVARKIDIPDSQAQFDHVRPDMLLLRAAAKHIVLWNDMPSRDDGAMEIRGWISLNLPTCYRGRLRENAHAQRLKSSDIAFYNIVAGLVWALSLKFAGSGNPHARAEILSVYDRLHAIKAAGDAYYYDAKLARSSIRRGMDVVALAAATVMAGTGDLETFRYLRRLHGRTDAETSYGSHLAAHLAIGVLFLGGGTYTLGTSDLAVAALMCAFYPLFPTDVQDNYGHLQAFRHLWVLAAEARCLVVEDIDTCKPIRMPLKITLRDGSVKTLQAPCLLPDLDSIATVQSDDTAYWRVTLDFAANPAHLAAFRRDQRINARRCPASEAYDTVFSATLTALNNAQPLHAAGDSWQSIFNLPALQDLERAELDLVLPPDLLSSIHTDERGTVVDDKLVFGDAVVSNRRDDLWNLRVLMTWAERARDQGHGKLRWIGHEVIEALKARVEGRMREVSAARNG